MKLAAFLNYLIESQEYRLVDLSKDTGIPTPDLSNIVRGQRPCGEKNLLRLVKGLKPEFQAKAVVAWLEDRVPRQVEELVHILRADGGTMPVEERLPSPETLEGSLEVLRVAAQDNATLRAVLTNLARAFS